MKNDKDTIRRFVNALSGDDSQPGHYLPNIQRKFVWKEEQIERLFDSILREYPIGTLLIWNTAEAVRKREFIKNYRPQLKHRDFIIPDTPGPKKLVLDGQQRLQSLFIGLKGTYEGKQLAFNVYSGDKRDPEDMRFEFKFKLPEDIGFPWVRLSDLVNTDKKVNELCRELKTGRTLSDAEQDRMENNVGMIREVFCTQENIVYQLVDGVDRPDTYKVDDVVEIFIRANSGGTTLTRSDLMFSLLTNSWSSAEDDMDQLTDDLNRTGYAFDRDFVLKCCLTVLDKGSRYNVEKVRSDQLRTDIENNWKSISNAIRAVKDFVYGKTLMRTDKTLVSYQSLVPAVYFYYKHKDQWSASEAIVHDYLLRASLGRAFSGSPDSMIDSLVEVIRKQRTFDQKEIYGAIRQANRNLEITEESLLNLSYWDKEIHLIFSLWYGFNYQPALKGNAPQLDHIFPQSVLKKQRLPNPETGKMNIMKYKWWDQDQLANMMLLTANENGAAGKSDILPEVWFESKPDTYLDLHLIPKDRDLWKLENYDRFLVERRKLIVQKFAHLISKQTAVAAPAE